ncbi:protein kinase, partial [Mycobacterium numidiamassiliense]
VVASTVYDVTRTAIVAQVNGFHGGKRVDGARRFGRYHLVESLYHDGMGEVWRAFDPRSDRFVALRMLPAGCAADAGFHTRFRRNTGAAAGLDEPHVVKIHDFGEIDGRLFVTMQLLDSRNLQDILDAGPVPPARAVWIIEQIASALHAAHDVGLVHSNVNPTNILVAEDDFAYLTDFGIATEETGLTKAGASRGANWSYTAPERFRTGRADVRADVYGLACVLYQSLTGQRPFPGAGRDQLAAHMFKPPPQPSKIQPGVPPAMDQIIATGMAKEPDLRYATTKELAKAARLALATPMHPTSPASPRNRAAPTPRKGAPPAKPATKSASARRPTDRYRPRHAGWNKRASAARRNAEPGGQPLPIWASIVFAVITISAVAALILGIIIMGHSAFRGGTTSTTSLASAGSATHDGHTRWPSAHRGT